VVEKSSRPISADSAFEPDLTLWDAWRPAEAARLLAGVRAPWCVTAGWAIDLFLGDERRAHDDLEIAVPDARFAEVSGALADYELFVPCGPNLVRPFAPGAESHQTWVREPESGRWRLDVFRDPSDGGTWICRRDERIRLPYRELIEHTNEGIPYARPEIVLLFKAKHHALPKNEADFSDTLRRLQPARRRYLADLLTLTRPDHPWTERVACSL
jgi:Aminoglycoside-2''-adenylyltransferase